MGKNFSEVTPQILELSEACQTNFAINPELYQKYEGKRGLRDVSGQGVLTGLTEISEITSYTMVDRDMIPGSVK